MDVKSIISQVRYLDVVTNRKVTDVFAGNYKSSFKGQGMEIADVREYEAGDDARHIDWVVTARQGKTYLKQYQETRELTTLMMVDLSASMNFTSTGKTKRAVAIELAAVLLFSALRMNDKFGVILFAEGVEKYIPPRKGKSHLLRILREMLWGFEQNKYKRSNPLQALKFLNTVVKAQSICFYIGDEITEAFASQLKMANRKHDFIFLHVYDPFEQELNHDDFMTIEDSETGEQMIIDLSNKRTRERFAQIRKQKREIMKSVIQKNQVDLVEVATDGNVYKELLLFFKKRQSRF